MSDVIVSDVHLGDRASKIELWLSFLNYLRSRDDVNQLILNGDVLDLWREYELVVLLKNFDATKALLRFLDKKKVVYVIGNHDFRLNKYIDKLNRLHDHLTFVYPELRTPPVLVTHGHLQYSLPITRTLLKLSEWLLFTKVFGYLSSRTFILNAYDKLLKIVTNRLGQGMKNHLFLDKTRRIVKSREITCVCYGHTHQPELYREDDWVMANSGDWVQHSTYLELSENKIKLFRFINSPELLAEEEI